MATKKKTARRKRAKDHHVEHPPGSGEMRLQLAREHLLEAELLYSRRDAAQNLARLKATQAEKLEQDAVLRVRALRADAAAAEREAKGFQDEAKAFFGRIAAEYGVDFSRCTYDSDSGIITEIEE